MPTVPKELLPPRMMMRYEPERFRANHKTPAPTASAAKRTRRPTTRKCRRFSVVLSQRLVFGTEQPIPLVPIEGLPCIIVKRPSRVLLACAGPRVAYPAPVRRHRRAQDDRCALRSIRPKWAMGELTTRGFSSDGRTFPGPGVGRGCELASVPVRAFGPRAFSAVVDHVSPCWYQGRSPRGRIRRG